MSSGLRAKRVWKRDGSSTVMSLEAALRNIEKHGDPPITRAKALARLCFGGRVHTKTSYFLIHHGGENGGARPIEAAEGDHGLEGGA
jgi:hypothetical protein